MFLFIVLGLVVVMALVVLGILFYMLSKEGKKEDVAVPMTDLEQLRKELSTSLLEPQKPKASKGDFEVIAPFEPEVSLPVGEVKSPIDDSYKKRAQELEDELMSIAKKADDQSDEARRMVEILTEENESLKRQKTEFEEAQQKLMDLQMEASGLKTENITLQSQLDTTNAQVRLLEEEMAAVKIQMGEEIAQAKATVAELNQEKEALLAAPKPEADPLLLEVETLKTEQLQLRQKYEDLERTHQKLKELNTHLMEKNDLLQYEMVKARAQSSGLERISFNYKNQLEDFLKKVTSVQMTNDQLSQVKNRLEGVVEKIKLQNEELVKKDQLAQFELEKNRSRLTSLEREYEEFKSRAQQKSES